MVVYFAYIKKGDNNFALSELKTFSGSLDLAVGSSWQPSRGPSSVLLLFNQ